ncbi:MAG: hypothetical protein HYV27_14825 [Candidatus Hydrogenedentes bacterium]|nr:hypothetical protein [Candidatus Hydrogenedentota bacterium]
MSLKKVVRILVCMSFVSPAFSATLDLSKAVIADATANPVVAKAAQVLQEEIARRTGVSLRVVQQAIPSNSPAIVLQLADATPGSGVPGAPESYRIVARPRAARVELAGRDPRGVLFAAGRLIRLLELAPGEVLLKGAMDIAESPDVPIRVHQLGYRNTANSYDAWDLATFDRYIRDLILFGANGIELIPPLTPDERDSVVMKTSMWEMNAALSKLIGSYGIDVWLWLAAIDDVTTPEGAAEGLAKRRALFQSMAHLDAVFVPGGDDGETPAEILMPWLADLAVILYEIHPKATLWVSNQTFTEAENDYFFRYLEEQRPAWLAGVIYGPWNTMDWETMRARTPEQYPIRRYPDITHTIRCQYPIPDWDPVFAHTVGREPVLAMPRMHAEIYRRFRSISGGFGTYSDGIHDDLNKILWSALGWNPNMKLKTLLEEYGRVFFDNAHRREVAQGLLMLEDNNLGKAIDNKAIPATLAHWEALSEEMGNRGAANWRLQMFLFRARYDAYIQERARAADAAETAALTALANTTLSPEAAVAEARAALTQELREPVATALRASIEELGKTLHESIGYQLSAKPPYSARNPERGAMLDWLDQPLNNRIWLEREMQTALEAATPALQRAHLHTLAHWARPGPGSYYDNLGTVGEAPHVVQPDLAVSDPGALHSPAVEFPYFLVTDGSEPLRWPWLSQVQTLFGTPLKMAYTGLDPRAQYRVRITYAGRFKSTVSLGADDAYVIHGPLKQPEPIAPVEYLVPGGATQDGALELRWNLIEGRGCQVAEVWLLREGFAASN